MPEVPGTLQEDAHLLVFKQHKFKETETINVGKFY
jgi:hypothetical protein